jgi:hypothetical protein
LSCFSFLFLLLFLSFFETQILYIYILYTLSDELELQAELGNREVTNDELAEHCHKILKAGRVIPGYGHAVLR